LAEDEIFFAPTEKVCRSAYTTYLYRARPKVSPSDPVKGFNYLAISQSDTESIEDAIATGMGLENGMVEISSTIETVNGLGVENLMGSGSDCR
jgi:hypothetical protein